MKERTWVIKLNGQTIYRSQHELPTRLLTIKLRRDGWGLVYMEAEDK